MGFLRRHIKFNFGSWSKSPKVVKLLTILAYYDFSPDLFKASKSLKSRLSPSLLIAVLELRKILISPEDIRKCLQPFAGYLQVIIS